MFSAPYIKYYRCMPLALVALGLSACAHLEERFAPRDSSNLDQEPRFNQRQTTVPTDRAPIDNVRDTGSSVPRNELKNVNPQTSTTVPTPPSVPSTPSVPSAPSTPSVPSSPQIDTSEQQADTNAAPGDNPAPPVTSPDELPFGIPVPGRPGTVYSPYDRTAGFVDVSGMAPGTVVTDPYTGNKFKVP